MFFYLKTIMSIESHQEKTGLGCKTKCMFLTSCWEDYKLRIYYKMSQEVQEAYYMEELKLFTGQVEESVDSD